MQWRMLPEMIDVPVVELISKQHSRRVCGLTTDYPCVRMKRGQCRNRNFHKTQRSFWGRVVISVAVSIDVSHWHVCEHRAGMKYACDSCPQRSYIQFGMAAHQAENPSDLSDKRSWFGFIQNNNQRQTPGAF